MQITRASDGSASPVIAERAYWEMDFPDGATRSGATTRRRLVDEFEQLLLQAVEKRLRADVPVGAYLSGGVDSSMIVALACHLKGPAINTYTIRVDAPELDELERGRASARGTSAPSRRSCRSSATGRARDLSRSLIDAAEAPVIDTSCAALLQLARRVHGCGQKVVLTGEGADEWLVGYPWYKAAKLMGYLDVVPGLRLSNLARRAYLRLNKVPQFSTRMAAAGRRHRSAARTPGSIPTACSPSRSSAFTASRCARCSRRPTRGPSCDFPLERARRWHPLHRGIWIAARVLLAGHLLQAKGDRVAMHSSVEVRYPFLDEDVFDFLAKLHPSWKLRGFRDKHLLRLLAERWVPKSVARRHKVIFRAPLDSFHIDPEPPFVTQLLSEESLRKTGYFDVAEVHHWRRDFRQMRAGSLPRLSVEMGLAAVVATQLWHHQFMGGGLADLPEWSGIKSPAAAEQGK